MRLIDLQAIWQQAPHNAFTDLIYFHNEWWCTFREASTHVSPDGVLRIIKSKDGKHWQDMGHISEQNADLRDAKLSITPSGQLMVLGAAVYSDAEPRYRQCYLWQQDEQGLWPILAPVAKQNHWLWRLTWHKDRAYGMAYGTCPQDGLHWYAVSHQGVFSTHRIKEFDGFYVNEAGLAFDDDDTAYCLLRRDINPAEISTGLLGKSKPPYTDWQWLDLGFRIGGPDLVWHPDNKTLLAGYRRYEKPDQWLPQWTEVAELSLEGEILQSLQLPSGGDCSYPGLALADNNTVKVSYYSSHEEQTKIYCADIQLD